MVEKPPIFSNKKLAITLMYKKSIDADDGRDFVYVGAGDTREISALPIQYCFQSKTALK